MNDYPILDEQQDWSPHEIRNSPQSLWFRRRHTFKFSDTEYSRLSSDILQFPRLRVSLEELSPLKDATAKPNTQWVDCKKTLSLGVG
jgi:hypothetical protein